IDLDEALGSDAAHNLQPFSNHRSSLLRSKHVYLPITPKSPNILGNIRAGTGNNPADRHKAPTETTRRKDRALAAMDNSLVLARTRDPHGADSRIDPPPRLTHRPA